MFGEYGDDKIFGGAGKDVIWGDDKAGPGVDAGTADGSGADAGLMSGKDHLYGDGDDDIIYGGSLADKIHGGAGADLIWAGGGEDVVHGDDG